LRSRSSFTIAVLCFVHRSNLAYERQRHSVAQCVRSRYEATLRGESKIVMSTTLASCRQQPLGMSAPERDRADRRIDKSPRSSIEQ
jgi:hypothetical protein